MRYKRQFVIKAWTFPGLSRAVVESIYFNRTERLNINHNANASALCVVMLTSKDICEAFIIIIMSGVTGASSR